MADSDSLAKPKAGTYLFEIPGSRASVYISLDVVDRLQQDVMRGFGAVPKRGAEIGGILLGSAARSSRLNVDIEDYEMVPIEYKRGPSYQLSPTDLESYQNTLERLRHSSNTGLKPIGFFRSHTRDSAGLAADDLEFLDRFFPDSKTIVLLIKPYATRVSVASILAKEDGQFPTGAPLVDFPFRRKDLAPGDDTVSTRARSSSRTAPELVSNPREPAAADQSVVRHQHQGLDQAAAPDPEYAEFSESGPEQLKEKARNQWAWVPLSFIFLLLGVLLGFQAALTLRPQAAAGSSDPYNLQLSVSKEGDNLNVRWDRQALAIRSASRGMLVIADGTYNKTVDLDPNQLQTGSVVYRHNSGEVRFHLEVHPREHDVVIETFDWKE